MSELKYAIQQKTQRHNNPRANTPIRKHFHSLSLPLAVEFRRLEKHFSHHDYHLFVTALRDVEYGSTKLQISKDICQKS